VEERHQEALERLEFVNDVIARIPVVDARDTHIRDELQAYRLAGAPRPLEECSRLLVESER
jgi:hypothetical protein